MVRNPGILFWEAADDPTGKQTAAVDKNIIREIGNKYNVKYKMAGPSPTATYSMSGSIGIRQILDDPAQSNTNSDFGANPVYAAYLQVGMMSKDGGLMSPYRVDIRLTYHVEMTDPLNAENEN